MPSCKEALTKSRDDLQTFGDLFLEMARIFECELHGRSRCEFCIEKLTQDKDVCRVWFKPINWDRAKELLAYKTE